MSNLVTRILYHELAEWWRYCWRYNRDRRARLPLDIDCGMVTHTVPLLVGFRFRRYAIRLARRRVRRSLLHPTR